MSQDIMTEPASRMRDVRQFHDLITCGICRGYMVDPTTVDDCYHTYCRSCILKHLLRKPYCPECKQSRGKEISEITEFNLRSDNVLRTLIYKMVPGLYQRECQALADFEEQHKDLVDEKSPLHQEFFTATELVSLSLEYHPAMLQQCGAGEVPPIIYLQCAAALRVEQLKRFLCSKYNIEADNKLVEVEVTYEDEVLPSHFTLMDVGYCYKYSRQSPMAFCYRILLYESERAKNDENNLSRINQDIEPGQTVRRPKAAKSVSFAEDLEYEMDSVSPRSKARSNKSSPKVSPQSKGKRLAKKEADPEPVSTFKSLRSNDMRYSDYTVPKVKSEPEQELAESQREREQPLEANANIVVSIPPSQLIKSYGDAADFELKTANRKVSGNLPKLKIELNSMKSKLSMPLSAHGRLEDTSASASAQQLDLETYAKNIGLKPIEQPAALGVTDTKYSPNASPMSSCSSSTNGSTSSLGTADASTSTSTSSHRKRKKKHSKEPKDANGKRKKLHAEISSQTDGKMKVKITSTPKHKLDLKRSHSIAGGELALQQLKLDERSISSSSTSDVLNRTLGEEARSISSLVVGGAPTPPPTPTTEALVQQPPQVAVAKPKEMPSLPTSPPLPPSLFKAYTPSATPTVPAKTKMAPQHHQQQLHHLQQQQHLAHAAQVKTSPAVKPPLSNNNNRKLSGGHFAVPQAPGNRNLYHMQRYLSTPSSIASAANKQPKRSLSLDESHPAKQARFQEAQAMANYTAKKFLLSSQTATYLPNPQPRLYGPDMNSKTPMPLLCPTSMSLAGSSLGSGSVTITARPRANQLGYPYVPEASNQIPALEIVRLGPGSKQGGPKAMPPLSPPAASSSTASIGSAASRLMGPPAPLPSKNSLKMPMPMTTIPTIVKSPPLSVALSGQRGTNNNNKGNNSNNAAYRTSPPALINLRNTATHSATFPSKLQQQQHQQQSAKVEANSKKSPPAGTANGTTSLDSKSKTSLREFRPAVTAGAKDADILDLSANPGRNNQPNHATKLATTTPATATTTPTTTVGSNSLEAALNKIKQNISANSNGGNVASTTSSNANGSSNTTNSKNNNNNNGSGNKNNSNTNGNNTGDDLQNLHMLSESATAREKISIKVASFENKPKNANANALVRPQNASVRNIPNPSALAFRNQPAVVATTTSTTTATTTTNISKPLTVRAEDRSTKGLLSPNSTTNNNNNTNNTNNNNNSSSSSSSNNAATSPRAMTKKPTTIDQVAANLNIRAEAKAAALAEEAPPVLSSRTSKSPELAKTTTATSSRPEPKETSAGGGGAITVSAASTLLPMPVATVSSSSVAEPLSKPPVQIAATDTLAPVASSA